ncbi:VOC family protein [Kribbella sp. NPDC051952]|uniref:VOC family protein n=1 Tax=Kribbella sp. NPDC051952 TaxID=3154851 RepID=UPI00341940C7
MASRLNPYIQFDGDARAAMEFYQGVFGGDLSTNTFKEFGAGHGPDDDDKLMHSQLETPSGFTLMASDTPQGMPYNPGENIAISLSGDDELRGYYEKLSADGGKVSVPLEKQVWGDEFGMVQDKFGINWMVNVSAAES